MSDETELPSEVDETERGAWEAWLSNGNDEDAEAFRDAYAGEWDDVADYVADQFDEREFENVWYYIDWDDMARDWQLNGDIWVASSGNSNYIFRGY